MKYRYLTTLGFMDGGGRYDTRQDASNGQVLHQESSPFSGDSNEKDYSVATTVNDISEDNPIEVSLTATLKYNDEGKEVSDNSIWTHYCVYRTLDIENSNNDLATVSNSFVWVDDVPMCEVFHATKIGDTTYKGLPCLIFSYKTVSNGNNPKIVGSKIRSKLTNGNIFEGLVVGVTNDRFYVYNISGVSLISGAGIFTIGGGDTFLFSERTIVDSKTVKYKIGNYWDTESYNPIQEEIERKQIVFSDGSVGIALKIVEENGSNYLYVYEKSGVPTTIVPNLWTAWLNPTTRTYQDSTTDDVLEARRESGEPLYLLQTRFFEPLPNGKLSALLGGFYAVAPMLNSEYYYCQTADLYRAGFYHPAFQKNSKPKGGITRLKDYANSIVIFGRSFTYYTDPSFITNAGEASLGEYIPVMADPQLITDKIGLSSEGNASQTDNGGELILTTEPGIRYFNGRSYSDNLADGYVQEKIVAGFSNSVVSAWSKSTGLKIWGLNEF